MIAIACGQLGERLMADLIREAAQRHFSGALQLVHGEVSKGIFFEDGAPVFAISNLPEEQIARKLIRDRLLTPELFELARQRTSDPEAIGQTLIDLGVMSETDLQRATRELVEHIVESLFEWSEGDYIFEEAALPPHAIRADWTGADCVLRGARHAALINSVATLIAPSDTVVALADDGNLEFVRSARLNPTEGYVLSCIQAPTRVARISALTGLTEEETRRAVCVLLAIGALKLSVAKTVSAELDCNIVYQSADSGDLDSGTLEAPAALPGPETVKLKAPAALGNLDTVSPKQPAKSGGGDSAKVQMPVDSGAPAGSPEAPVRPGRLDTAPPVSPKAPGRPKRLDAAAPLSPGDSRAAGGTRIDRPASTANRRTGNAGEAVPDPFSYQPPAAHEEENPNAEAGEAGDGTSKAAGGASADKALDDWVLNEIRGKLMQFEISSYYDVLGVDRMATTETIRRAYYDIELMLESFRARWPAHHEMNTQLNQLLSAISRAYQTLIDPDRRREYDMPAGRRSEEKGGRKTAPPAAVIKKEPAVQPAGKAAAPNAARSNRVPIPKPIPISIPAPVKPPVSQSAPRPAPASASQPPPQSAPQSAPQSGPQPRQQTAPKAASHSAPGITPPPAKIAGPGPAPQTSTPYVGVDPYVQAQQTPILENPVAAAAEKYQQGRSRYDRRDFHAAAFLLREAAKLDPTRAEHHYTLARTLTVLSQARHNHDGHEGCHVTCNLGGALIRNQRVRYEAVQHFREAARLDPKNAKVRIELGQLYKDAGMQKKAEACFWEALLLDGTNETAMEELGLDSTTEVPLSDNPLAQRATRKATRTRKTR